MPSFILDTSALVNGWNFHYRLPVFQGVWDAIGRAMQERVVVSPSEVLEELAKRAGDPLHTWAAQFPAAFEPPEESWRSHLAVVKTHAPHWFEGTAAHVADPFVVAMAMERQLPVVTYEGVAFSGNAARVRTARRAMPHVCALVNVRVASMFDVLDHLGVVL